MGLLIYTQYLSPGRDNIFIAKIAEQILEFRRNDMRKEININFPPRAWNDYEVKIDKEKLSKGISLEEKL